jgi:drug/metabolite transporter (DMT)-like permease
MGFLALHIVTNATFLLLVSIGRRPRFYYPLVGFTNYATAGVLALVALALSGPARLAPAAALWGAVNGAQYQVTYLLMFVLYGMVGLAVTSSVMRLSVVVPVLASIAIWNEWPTLPQAAGLALAACALPLLTRGSARINASAGSQAPGSLVHIETPRAMLGRVTLMGVTLLISGCGLLAAKAFAELEQPEQRPVYVLAAYTTATVLSVIAWPWHRHFSATPRGDAAQTRRSLALGIVVGAMNIAQIWVLLPALAEVPGVIAFPVAAAGGLALATLGARFLLHERLPWPAYAGIGLAMLAAALANVR